ncbi:nucleolar protein [Colletotrichum incanum]|nr:nucleolar protein [Colletotrichum incanum]
MFELPDAKRVRREDLDASSEDEAAGHDEQQDAELLAKLHARVAGMLDLSGIDQAPTKTTTDGDAPMADGTDPENQDDDAGPEEFEFRLFTTTDPATKIALVDEDELALQGDGDMLRKRPLSYYIAGEPTAEARAELAFAAVSGEEVLARAGQRWWGMEMPWRVTRVPGTSRKGSKTANPADGGEEEGEAARRRRPGKKKRVALRVKERERKKKAEEQEKAKMGKEEALKEKKKRLNRLKKLRKRAKAKEGKKGGGEDGAEDDGSGSGSDGSDA